ncbi:UNVERIFIED_CONTAM: hypothetical protein RMT77_009983 [Armadillidium vulgare]
MSSQEDPELLPKIRCRDEQLKSLKGLIREDSTPLPASIFVFGLPGTGKSLLLNSVFRYRNVRICYANCIEFYSPKIIYERILNQMSDVEPRESNNFSSYASCDNMNDFVRYVKEIDLDRKERYAFIFEHSERLRDCCANIFPALCRLQELCEDVNVCVVFSSRLSLDKFRVPMGFLEPFVIHFPQYTKDETVDILVSEQPMDCCLSKDGYKNYISLLLSVFYLATRNLPELKHLAELHLKSYCDPVIKGEAKEDELRFLWKNIEPKFKKALSTVYLREVSSEQFMKIQESMDSEVKVPQNNKPNLTKIELPFYSKFLLISAYLASYNPPKSDKRFFTKNHGKKRKTQAMIKAKQKSCSQLVGPKPFPLDRLLAIFYSIIEDKVAPTAHVFTQITSLVSLRLLTSVGNDDPLSSPKYKSNVSFDFIRFISRTVNFEIVQYLYDYSS